MKSNVLLFIGVAFFCHAKSGLSTQQIEARNQEEHLAAVNRLTTVNNQNQMVVDGTLQNVLQEQRGTTREMMNFSIEASRENSEVKVSYETGVYENNQANNINVNYQNNQNSSNNQTTSSTNNSSNSSQRSNQSSVNANAGFLGFGASAGYSNSSSSGSSSSNTNTQSTGSLITTSQNVNISRVASSTNTIKMGPSKFSIETKK